jgi:ubiquinone/menaquinone biosynthesis C-methylase UbiE
MVWKYVDFSDLISLHVEVTGQSYDTHSKEYAEKWEWDSDVIEITRRDYLTPFMKQVKKGGMVLVVGCGTGRDLRVLDNSGYICLGVDNSKGMLEEAINRNGIKSPLVCESIENINLADESFDGILIDSALEHVKKADMPKVLLKLYNAL